jgi:hypothetical protein
MLLQLLINVQKKKYGNYLVLAYSRWEMFFKAVGQLVGTAKRT